jgi:hypothetical protein
MAPTIRRTSRAISRITLSCRTESRMLFVTNTKGLRSFRLILVAECLIEEIGKSELEAEGEGKR